ncbi:MAG: LysR family transcriptional regulator [Anaerolineales bacterium]|nr:LysR family transcriptional regulator [Anaerolineales bacterium]MBS3753171.1 LysR family transcriptional regulator [Anaerolineales bacterium]
MKYAPHLHLSQPTVSRYIKTLEIGLGALLLQRTGKSLHSADAGQLLLHWDQKGMHGPSTSKR